MKRQQVLRFSIIAVLLVLGVFWALVSAKDVPPAAIPMKASWLTPSG